MNKAGKSDVNGSTPGLKVYGVVHKSAPTTAGEKPVAPIPANDPVNPPPRAAKGDDDLMSQGKKPS